MDYRSKLLNAFSHYCEVTGLAPSTVSKRITNDGKFYDNILKGAGFTMQRYEKIMLWFQNNPPTAKVNKKSLAELSQINTST